MMRIQRTARAVLALSLLTFGWMGPGCSSSTDALVALGLKYRLETAEGGLIVNADGATVVLRTTGDSALNGSIDVDAEGLSIASGTVLTVDDNAGALIGSFVLTVTQTIRVSADSDFPTAGQFEMTAEEAFEGRVTVTVDNSIPGVRIDIDADDDGTPETTLTVTWEEFEELADSEDSAERAGPAAFEVIELLIDQLDFLLTVLDEIDFNAQSLEDDGSIGFECDTLPEALEDVPPTGEYLLELHQDFGVPGVSAGDAINVTLTDCYEAFDGTTGLLRNGMVFLRNYILEENNVGLITRFGFESVEFSNVDLIDLDFDNEDPVDSVLNIAGGFSIAFFLD